MSHRSSERLLDYIVSAKSKVPFRRRFSRVVSTCKILESQAVSAGNHDNIDDEIHRLLYHICSKCKDWAEADIVQVIVRVQHEMSGIETDIEIVCNKIGILSQTRLVEDRERDNNKDLDHLIQKTMDLLSHKEFRDACLALKNNQAEDMMKFIHEILLRTTPDNLCRNDAFKLLNSLSKRCNKLVAIPVITIEQEILVKSGGFGSISRATHNGTDVAVKALIFYLEKDNSKAERMLRREILLWNLITQQRHPHILPLIGIIDSQFPQAVKMVAPWQEHGDLLEYVKKPNTKVINRLRLVCLLSYSGIVPFAFNIS